jgi:hypothetical protein
VRSLRNHLTTAINHVQELRRRLAGLVQVAGQLTEMLKVRLELPALGNTGHLIDWAGQLAKLGPVRRSWFDAARRQELQTVLVRCREDRQAAQALRVELLQSLSPVALREEQADLAGQASRFSSGFLRLLLFPSWRRLKSEAQRLYAGEAPATTRLLEDMHQLAAYHRRLQFGRQVRQQYEADLLFGEDGEPDWDRTAEGLSAVEQVERTLKTPSGLVGRLTEEAALDRSALAAGVAGLAAQHQAVQEQLNLIGSVLDLSPVLDPTRQ